MKQFLFTLTLLSTLFSFSQNSGSIYGKVSDKEFNNEPLPQCNVLIKGTTQGATTDFDGLYTINNIEPGSYTLEISFIGYKTQEIAFEIIAGDNKEINAILAASTATLDEVVIQTTTKRESETALLLDQKKAVEIKQSIGADELSRKGVSDAAGAVAKISGVSKQEGSSNVYVRGLGDRYLNTTLNGLSLPSNDVNKKNIDLNLFASDVIENVSISKAYSSRFYGDFAAGNVDISSKNYKGKGFFDFTASTGINSRAAGQNFVRSEGTGYFGYYGRYDHNPFAVIVSHGVDPVNVNSPINVGYGASAGKSFDFENDSRLSLFATASFENDYEYRKGKQTDFTSVFKKIFPETEEFEYSTTTTAMLNANYKIDSNSKVQFNSLFINSSSDQVGYYGIGGNGFNRDSQSLVNDQIGFYQQNIQFNQDLIYVNQLIGSHKFDKLKADWAIGYNRVNSHEPDRKRFSIENYQLALDNDPTTNPSFFNNVNFDNQRYFQDIEDEELNSRLNFTYELKENTKLNFGFNGRSKTRDFENIRYGFDVDDQYTISDVSNLNSYFNVNNINLNSLPLDGSGLYNIKVINAAVDEYGNTNAPGAPENTYSGKLDVYAGYANAELKFGDKWLVVPGARIESFKQRIEYDVINLPANEPGFRETENVFFLPSLSIKYALNDDQNLRFSASKTVSTPEFKEMAPFVYEGVTQRIGGNPDLLNNPSFSSIYNIDFKYEWFVSRSEIVSIAAFGKQINDPINLVIANDATGTQRYFRTGDKATILGIELEARKTLLVNEDEKPKLSAGFNATYMHTEQDLKSSTGLYSSTLNRTDKLQGASPLIINADLSYTPTFGEKYKPTANLVFSYFSDRISALGSGQLGNIIEKGIPTVDFVLKNKIGKDFEINFSAKNLLDPSIERVRENTSFGDVTLSEYKRGIDLGLQLKYKF
ncbi:TonB-dependent receptor [uncultured Lacinutrix sp.]|uniref:TonB-dependent receptor n=1 Tax=uncultured Lacinutrix sp. TaxID=574032 RepID=UPI002612A121|nr:TonB-dependent receptor [uncultured Lacinutrix sp.]